jgi:hypothetical protein
VSDAFDVSGPESVRQGTRLLLVSNDAMRARRRPIAVFAYYIYQLAVSVCVAWPISRGLAALFGGHPRGDGVLFDDGGWALLALRTGYDRVAPALWGLVFVVMIFGAVIGLVPLAALITSISHVTPETRAPRPRHLAPYVVAAFGPLGYLLAMGAALELALLAIAMWTFGAVGAWAEPRWGEARGDQIGALACALVLVLAMIAAVLHDLARVSVVRYRTRTFGAIRAALRVFRRAPLRVLWSWIWRSSISLSLVVLVALVVPAFTTRQTLAIIAIAILHQLVVLARVALRASWLARSLRAADRFGAPRRR